MKIALLDPDRLIQEEKEMRAIIGILFSLAFASTANATVIDMDDIASGSNVSTIGDVTFSLAGVGESGDPSVTTISGQNYMWNSTDDHYYPTNSILKAEFSSDVTGIIFDFNNHGSKTTTTWSLFDVIGDLIVSGSLIADRSIHTYDLSSYTGVRSIEWNNGGNNWSFGLTRLEYTSEVPVPATLALLGLGLIGLGATRRKA